MPANTLLFRSEGLQVAVVRNGRAELVGVTIGRDYGGSVEVVSGVGAKDAVILDPSDSLVSGAAVRVRPSEPPKPKPGGETPAARRPGRARPRASARPPPRGGTTPPRRGRRR